jgi:hypothetical protein
VETPQEPTEIGQRHIGHRPGGIGRERHVALEVRHDLAALIVHAQVARGTVEPDRLEVAEQGPHARSRGTSGPTDRVADPDGGVAGVHAADEGFFRCHRTMVVEGASERQPCRTRTSAPGSDVHHRA